MSLDLAWTFSQVSKFQPSQVACQAAVTQKQSQILMEYSGVLNLVSPLIHHVVVCYWKFFYFFVIAHTLVLASDLLSTEDFLVLLLY